ncbi:MAG: hypothetical protein QOI79_62 [Mycobacterium sp.]|nr:hypothetical protein [Mycobacterium sp.]
MTPADVSKAGGAPARLAGVRLRDLFTIDNGLLLPGVPNALTAAMPGDAQPIKGQRAA